MLSNGPVPVLTPIDQLQIAPRRPTEAAASFRWENLAFEGGDLLIPTAPGLGVELIEENFSKYPYQPTDLPLFESVEELQWKGPTREFAALAGRLDAATLS